MLHNLIKGSTKKWSTEGVRTSSKYLEIGVQRKIKGQKTVKNVGTKF